MKVEKLKLSNEIHDLQVKNNTKSVHLQKTSD